MSRPAAFSAPDGAPLKVDAAKNRDCDAIITETTPCLPVKRTPASDPSDGEDRTRRCWLARLTATRELRVLTVIFTVNLLLGFVQAGYAWGIRSIALLGSALNMLVDALSYAVNMWAAMAHASPSADARHRVKVEIIAATVSLLTLVASTAYIIFEAVKGMNNPSWSLDGVGMIGFSLVGLAVDAMSTVLLFVHCGAPGDREPATPRSRPARCRSVNMNDLNMMSVVIHVVIDLLRGIAVVVAALLIHLKVGASGRVDALAAFVVAGLTLIGVLFLGQKTASATYKYCTTNDFEKLDQERADAVISC